MLISEVEQMEKDFAQCQEGHAQLLAENADLRRQLAASQQEAVAAQARVQELHQWCEYELGAGNGCPWCGPSGYVDDRYWHQDGCPFDDDDQTDTGALDAALEQHFEEHRLKLLSWGVCLNCMADDEGPHKPGCDRLLEFEDRLAEARREGRGTERQLTKEVITLARQRLRREGAEAERERCEDALWKLSQAEEANRDRDTLLAGIVAIRALEADTS